MDEYAYRFSRRHRPDLIFGRCVAVVAACHIWTYWDIIGRKPARKKSKLQEA